MVSFKKKDIKIQHYSLRKCKLVKWYIVTCFDLYTLYIGSLKHFPVKQTSFSHTGWSY